MISTLPFRHAQSEPDEPSVLYQPQPWPFQSLPPLHMDETTHRRRRNKDQEVLPLTRDIRINPLR